MKKKLIILSMITCLFVCMLTLSACDLGTDGTPPNYNEDVQAVAPNDILLENFVAEEGATYYTSPGLSLWMEINGAYFEYDYFSLDGNKRIYDNMYLYEGDYFYMITEDMEGWYASLSDPNDTEYAEEEKEDGYDIQINIKRSGIYRLTFDVDTLKFDLEYKSEIETPVYYTIKNCSVYSTSTKWVDMQQNPANAEEFVLENFSIEANAFISFFSHLHTSNYKVTLAPACDGTLASAHKTSVTVNVGGSYDIYINAKTYVVRLVLRDPDTATYTCVYYDGEFHSLSPVDAGTPYLFRHRMVVDTKNTTSVPKFYTEKSRTYALSVAPSDLLVAGERYHYFKEPGTYDLTINLKTFEITVERVPA